MPLKDGKPVKDAKIIVRAGPNAAPDGLAMDAEGRLYIAANREGKIWRYDPATDEMMLIAEGMFGCASLASLTGMGDPNFILVLEDKTYLVSDDATADIYHVGDDGVPELWSTAVNHPNGLALSEDGSTLYVARIFTNIRPVKIRATYI